MQANLNGAHKAQDTWTCADSEQNAHSLNLLQCSRAESLSCTLESLKHLNPGSLPPVSAPSSILHLSQQDGNAFEATSISSPGGKCERPYYSFVAGLG